jgi:hypothetical protein
MKFGGKYRIWVPSKLAYGARGAGRAIGPNSLLIFDVEPIEIANCPLPCIVPKSDYRFAINRLRR